LVTPTISITSTSSGNLVDLAGHVDEVIPAGAGDLDHLGVAVDLVLTNFARSCMPAAPPMVLGRHVVDEGRRSRPAPTLSITSTSGAAMLARSAMSPVSAPASAPSRSSWSLGLAKGMSVLPFVIDTGVADLPWSPSPAPDRSAISISSAMRVMSPVMREARCLPDRLGVLALHVYQRHMATHLLILWRNQ